MPEGFLGKFCAPQLYVEVRSSGTRGRGVFAHSPIPPHTTIERCPILLIPGKDRILTDRSIVFTYVFMWEAGTREQELYAGVGRAAIALGVSSLLNHSFKPNVRFIRHFDTLELEIVSLTRIEPGQELTIDYDMDLWFVPCEE